MSLFDRNLETRFGNKLWRQKKKSNKNFKFTENFSTQKRDLMLILSLCKKMTSASCIFTACKKWLAWK